ncbi:MAG: hypothetical protein EOM43_00120 [Gammaproteobacteria bacterium]|nr:hypothetical protein [Gammaproteobacteria bacterium]
MKTIIKIMIFIIMFSSLYCFFNLYKFDAGNGDTLNGVFYVLRGDYYFDCTTGLVHRKRDIGVFDDVSKYKYDMELHGLSLDEKKDILQSLKSSDLSGFKYEFSHPLDSFDIIYDVYLKSQFVNNKKYDLWFYRYHNGTNKLSISKYMVSSVKRELIETKHSCIGPQ